MISALLHLAVMLLVVMLMSPSSGAGAVVTVAEDIGSPLRIAQCRAGCLQRFSNGVGRGSVCLQGPDCFMCWENCELLQSNFPVWGAMCSEKGICFPGCEEACRFHQVSASTPVQHSQPVIHTHVQQVVHVSGGRASWPRPHTTDPATPLVYVLMMMRRRAATPVWSQLTQTVDLSARVPDTADPATSTVRVLVVDPHGLVTMYSPVTTSTSTSTVDALVDSLPGIAGHRRKINTEVTPSTARAPVTATPWTVRAVSLIHQRVLVIAEVAWTPRAVAAVYLVTWEVDGGGLKGNLYTDSTCVTLSLWPDTVYHIQVELVSKPSGRQPDRSTSLRLDTHRARPAGPDDGVRHVDEGRGPGVEARPALNSPLLSVLVQGRHLTAVHTQLMAAAAAAMLLLVLLLAAAVWRWRRAPRKTTLDVPAGFQPVMTLGKACRGFPASIPVPCTSTRPADDEGGVTNPLLRDASSDVDAVDVDASTASFLRAAERSARNEVQV